MTHQQMDDAIQKYCDGTAEEGETLCENCKIEHLCAPIDGMFEQHPDKLEQAYDLIRDEVTSSVAHPSHYNQGDIECIDAMISAFGKEVVANFCMVNAFKYIWRADHKNGIQDIDKASWYLNKYKELMGNE